MLCVVYALVWPLALIEQRRLKLLALHIHGQIIAETPDQKYSSAACVLLHSALHTPGAFAMCL